MLMETQEVIIARQQQAKKWQTEHSSLELSDDKIFNALLVLLLDPRHSKYLAEHDPLALKQAQKAISDKCWEDY